MSKYLRKFNDEAAYSAATIYIPSVSLIIENMTIKFDPISQYEYVDLGLPSGLKWATNNIGAASETDAGLYFQWGDTSGYTADQVGMGEGHKIFSWTEYKYGNGTSNPSESGITKYQGTGEGKDGLTTLEAVDDAARANMGDNWRMPTEAEFTELLSGTTNEWVTDYKGSGVNGRLFTSKANGKTIFFPAAGKAVNFSVGNVGNYGFYWSSSLNTGYITYSVLLEVSSYDSYTSGTFRGYGLSVRCVKD